MRKTASGTVYCLCILDFNNVCMYPSAIVVNLDGNFFSLLFPPYTGQPKSLTVCIRHCLPSTLLSSKVAKQLTVLVSSLHSCSLALFFASASLSSPHLLPPYLCLYLSLFFSLSRFSPVIEMCLEKRAFYRIISGLHASINIHLSAKYLMSGQCQGATKCLAYFKSNHIHVCCYVCVYCRGGRTQVWA